MRTGPLWAEGEYVPGAVEWWLQKQKHRTTDLSPVMEMAGNELGRSRKNFNSR